MTPEEVLQKYFNYSKFRPGQLDIINAILDGSNVLAVLPTGAGKSLCYQIPALMGENFSIVISPLIALMKDQVDSINKNKKIAAFINSSLNYNQTREVINDVSNGIIKILFVAPERLENIEFVSLIKNLNANYLFVDEAHCISEWGHNFRPSYRNIKSFCDVTGITKISAFTATANPEVQEDIIHQLDFKDPKRFIKGFERNNIAINVIKESNKKELCIKTLKSNKLPAIIYTATRKLSEEVAEYLQFKKYNAASYHAGLSGDLRKMIQDDFINDRTDIIVATNAFGMGIDKPNIRTIIHYNMPASIENYYQEFGRAGRDGELSNVYLLFSPRDKAIQKYFVENSYPTETDIRLTYNMICDYGRIAIGSAINDGVKLDKGFEQLVILNKMNSIKLLHAVNVLENSGYLKRGSSAYDRFEVNILMSKERVKRFVETESNTDIKNFILMLLKEYGYSVLEEKIRFNPAAFAKKLDIPGQQLTEIARWMHNAGIIEFTEPSDAMEIILTGTRIKAQNLALQSESLRYLIESARTKLESITDFVNTTECRFKSIIKYFGEQAEDYKCGKCDNCLGKSATGLESLDYLKEIIIETMRDQKTPIRSKDMIKLLLGRSNHPGIRKSSNFGRIKHFSEEEINDAIIDLVSGDLLQEYEGVLKLSAAGSNYILEDKADDAANTDKDDFNAYLDIYNSLKEIREFAAKKFAQRPELICPDPVLQEVARSLPVTPSTIMQIKGFNQRHYNKVGEDFLEAIRKYKKDSEIKSKLSSDIPEHSFKVYDLIQKRYSLEDIVSFTKLPEAVVSMQIESLLEIDPTIEISFLFDSKDINIIEEQIKTGDRNIKSIKSKVPSSISYGKVRILLAKYKNQSTT